MEITASVGMLVEALRLIGCQGQATAADVIEQVDARWPPQLEDEMLAEMAIVELEETHQARAPRG